MKTRRTIPLSSLRRRASGGNQKGWGHGELSNRKDRESRNGEGIRMPEAQTLPRSLGRSRASAAGSATNREPATCRSSGHGSPPMQAPPLDVYAHFKGAAPRPRPNPPRIASERRQSIQRCVHRLRPGCVRASLAATAPEMPGRRGGRRPPRRRWRPRCHCPGYR